MQRRGEPYFLTEDTDLAIALAAEEADTCPSCGYPKAWCRPQENQFAFEVQSEQCHVTYALATHGKVAAEDASRQAAQRSARFRAGYEPDTGAGLDLELEGHE